MRVSLLGALPNAYPLPLLLSSRPFCQEDPIYFVNVMVTLALLPNPQATWRT